MWTDEITDCECVLAKNWNSEDSSCNSNSTRAVEDRLNYYNWNWCWMQFNVELVSVSSSSRSRSLQINCSICLHCSFLVIQMCAHLLICDPHHRQHILHHYCRSGLERKRELDVNIGPISHSQVIGFVVAFKSQFEWFNARVIAFLSQSPSFRRLLNKRKMF